MLIKALISLLLVSFACSLSSAVLALSEEAEQGRQYFAVCDACHNPSLDPPLAPPMWAVQQRYQKKSLDKERFIELLVAFVRSPSIEKANFKDAISMHGLMPLISLPEEALRSVATFIAETEFPPPCEHWKKNIARLKAVGNETHAEEDRNRILQFCQ